jgi:hypothetical protein
MSRKPTAFAFYRAAGGTDGEMTPLLFLDEPSRAGIESLPRPRAE